MVLVNFDNGAYNMGTRKLTLLHRRNVILPLWQLITFVFPKQDYIGGYKIFIKC